ncbi:MAG: FGGY family carbohydrate kinase [Anaeroplasmataceae bacterium]
MSKYIMTIDQGTTSSRVILFDSRANIIFNASHPVKQIYKADTYVEHDAMEIYEDVVELVLKALNETNIDYADIIGVGITNQRETTVLWDKRTGKPIYNAIVWQSKQSNYICEKWTKAGYNDIVREKTGLIINPYFSASKIRYILDNVEGASKMMEDGNLLFGTIDSWLIYKLTGKHVTDITNASRTLLFNIFDLKWDQELLDLFKINKNILPKVVDCNNSIGTILEPRIKNICNLEICGLAGDQQSSLIGHTCLNKGNLKITYGTGSFMLLNTGDKPFMSKHGLLTTIGYSIDGNIAYALEGSVFVAGSAFQFIKENLEIIKSFDDEEFNNLNSNGVVFVPALTGLGAPYWDSEVKGAIFGLTRSTTKAQIARATIEGVAHLNKDVLDSMIEDTNITLDSISVDGGASKNKYLMQYEANIMAHPIKTLSTSEATSLGVFYLVGINRGLFKNLEDIKKLYKAVNIYEVEDINLEEKQKVWKNALNACRMFK